MLDIDELKFDSNGLIPAIIVDDDSGDVLMMAYMNKESLKISLEKKLTCFWSRSRNELWLKGQTSGNYQHIKEIKADCDRDTLLVFVKPDGPACHLGNYSCFVDDVVEREEEAHEKFTLCGLMELIKGRKAEKVEGSYTSYLFEKGLDKILKKIGEESSEVIIAAKNDRKETIYEISDLIYHMLVLMAEMDIEIKDVIKELGSRHVIDKKVKQEKMTS
ncbi:MAG: bifunctional phosphoribosyl-AMP cyclohydrolase/phosphoribosyl-ATP diphosphatase HisIE [Synergistaceae bacterium]|nr:bifunctional phosphoribosyl-AMP cyclohydrolase/phosphoribosyl-ATP diphosphatase HisIE [Synergistaceae bacterium]